MEFEKDTPASDADRRLAEAKKLTLQPVHTDITPEGPTDSEIATRHIIEPPIANINADTEDNTTQIQPTQSLLNAQSDAVKSKPHMRVIGLAIGTVVFAGLAIYAMMK